MKSLFTRRFRAIFILTLLIAFQTVGTLAEDNAGQKTDYIYYKGDKVARVKVHEEIRREGAELISKVVSRVEMWADGVGSLTFSFRANAFVKGTANALKTTPPGDRYLQVSRNIVTYTSDKVAYAGATQKTVSRFQVPFAKPINRSFQMDGSGNDSYRIGYTSSPTSASDYLDPYAWAKGSILGGNENFQPGSRILESEAGKIINLDVDENGNPVDPNTETSPCGHLLSASGDHSLQASCSVTNSNGQSCTRTNFYACQSHTHTYPTDRRCMRVLVGGTCAKGGYVSSSDNHFGRCSQGHVYFDCHPAAVEYHKVRRCARCSNTYQNCQGNSNPCISGRGHSETADPPAEAPSTPQPAPSPPSETPPTTSPEESTATENEEQATEKEDTTEVPAETPSARPTAVCGSGHTYFTDGRYALNQHRDRTCTRCSQTYQNCSNSATACQGRAYHTEDESARPKPTSNSDTNNNGNGNENGNNGGNEDTPRRNTPGDNTPSENTPQAPSKPAVTLHACGLHRSTVSGDHSLQASCSTDSNCIATNFYQCMHLVHKYSTPQRSSPDPSRPRTPEVTTRPCGHPTTRRGSHSWVTTCGYYNSAGDRCTNTSGYYRCKPHTHEYPDRSPPSVVCPANSWTNCGGTTSHAATCGGGHTYYTCGTATAWHQDRTCTRCSQTYQNCGNSATACQGSRWHTETPQTPPPPTTVACARAECGETVSDRLAHKVADCPNCDSHYWTCIDGAEARHTTTYTCRRDGCGQTFTRCSNTPTACVRPGKPSNYHWASD